MAKPTKLARAKNRVMRLRVMLREAEEGLHALETKEVQQEHYSAQQQYNRLAIRVDDCNRRQLERERGSIGDHYNPFGDIERLMVMLKVRLRGNGGI